MEKNGEKFPIGFFTNHGSQEGRHRALAAMELGCDKIPVVLFTDVSYDERVVLASKYSRMSREELNQLYVEKGYNGITDLDWHDLQRFIQYNIK